jgi:dynein heavy chain
VTARKNEWELDKLVTQTDMTKRMSSEEIEAHSKDGAFIVGLSMQVRTCISVVVHHATDL